MVKHVGSYLQKLPMIDGFRREFLYIFNNMQWAYFTFKIIVCVWQWTLPRAFHVYSLLCRMTWPQSWGQPANQSANVPRVWYRKSKGLLCSVQTYSKGWWVYEQHWISNSLSYFCLSLCISLSLSANRMVIVCKYFAAFYSQPCPRVIWSWGHTSWRDALMVLLPLKNILPQTPSHCQGEFPLLPEDFLYCN